MALFGTHAMSELSPEYASADHLNYEFTSWIETTCYWRRRANTPHGRSDRAQQRRLRSGRS